MTLFDLPLSQTARVASLSLDPREAKRVRAVGVFEDEEVMVLRRAPFGGPIHLRTSSGGEFALDAGLAKAILVVGVDAEMERPAA